ncbi:DUF493 domain-containing protein [Campylobacter sp. TTU-622]|uniref:HP0495 family protein n=1 Tax=unclassified Campylobacter TaxID=2593542 RepID=UPI0019051FED|nr:MULTISPECIES: DUF493 domain-containing protein [unclassified Campylobacter]MBK1971792.1 DUF493 domain-containing protein [Campylobacter sp. TTU_617]MBK1973446.1 DUF493 domain-containing protein [Campylobacter sp. TTU-622]MBK1992088.1 DUF493 domain-containing protein [Campylobacter sp. 2018MI34]
MENIIDLNQEPIINYPTYWDYKVIFYAETKAEEIFTDILKQRDFKFKHTNSSKNGKYQSYLLSVYVDSKKDRLNIFEKLKNKAQFVL